MEEPLFKTQHGLIEQSLHSRDEIPEASALIVQPGADELHPFEAKVPRTNRVPVSAV
jgi:hypothetical protein